MIFVYIYDIINTMNSIKYLVLSTYLITNITLACDPVARIEKGEPSPCTGYVFSVEKEKEVRLRINDLDYYKSVAESKDREVNLFKEENQLLTEKSTLWKNETETQAKALASERSYSFWKSAAFFTLGALLTTGITYAVNHK